MIQKADQALEALKENSKNNLESLNNQTNENLGEIQGAVSEVTDLIENIKAASNEQAEGIRMPSACSLDAALMFSMRSVTSETAPWISPRFSLVWLFNDSRLFFEFSFSASKA